MQRRRVWEIVEAAREGDRWSLAFDVFIQTLILLNAAAIVVESMAEVHRRHASAFAAFEVFSVAVFAAEYALRLWSCTASERFRRPIAGRMRFAATPLAILDLLAFLPSILLIGVLDLRLLRVFRLVRLLRLAKLTRYSRALRLLGRVAVAKRGELAVTLVLTLFLLLMASCLMHHVEAQAQPDIFGDIPSTMWWAVATLTTVGYGDTYPVTPLGKALGSVVAVLGIGLFALPTGILGSGFVEEMQKERQPESCPHCGEPI